MRRFPSRVEEFVTRSVGINTRRTRWRSILGIVVALAAAALATMWGGPRLAPDRGWLDSFPCAPPCWLAITPGASILTPSEIEQFVDWLPMTEYVDTLRQDGSVLVRWSWSKWPWQRSTPNSVTLKRDVVQEIYFRVTFDLTVREIIAKWGSPETITVASPAGSPEYPYTRLVMIYPTRGLQFAVRLDQGDRPALRSTSPVAEVFFSAPAESLESWLESDPDRRPQQRAWPGYGRLP